jgi:hypothetical protein
LVHVHLGLIPKFLCGQIPVANASSERDIDAAFAGFVQARVNAIFIGGDPSSPAGEFKWRSWRHDTRYPQVMIPVQARRRED